MTAATDYSYDDGADGDELAHRMLHVSETRERIAKSEAIPADERRAALQSLATAEREVGLELGMEGSMGVRKSEAQKALLGAHIAGNRRLDPAEDPRRCG